MQCGFLRPSLALLTATPASYKLYDPGFRGKTIKRAAFRLKAGDQVAQYDKGPVEWVPRPVKLSYQHLDELRDWMMRETLEGKTDEFNKIRTLQLTWGQHPMRPVLGDVEPRLPKNLFKRNHVARRRFQFRWHKANHPLNWAWLPRGGTAPALSAPGDATAVSAAGGAVAAPKSAVLHRTAPEQYPENWQAMRAAGAGPQYGR